MADSPPIDDTSRRRRLELRGQVQGVGFRPFVYRVATELGLGGFVANDTNGAVIEIEGPPAVLDAFERRLAAELPPLARITAIERLDVARGAARHAFEIRESQTDAARRPEVTPDAATCRDCLRELFDRGDRRYRYPFINCTNCGPRYSIIRDVPYDRPKTTMAPFVMCPACEAEYRDPADRRFHAQPNACAVCGPTLRLIHKTEPEAQPSAEPCAVDAIPESCDVIVRAAALLRRGAIVALKGIGGYHLACRADDEVAVRRLRARKLRDGKPLAIMVRDAAAAGELCHVSAAAHAALASAAAPIVLMPRRAGAAVAPSVAPGCGDLGLMLPYAPLHHLLFAEGLGPLVMTSANLSGQPLTYRDEEALAELADVADAWVMHNREIERPIDDSVVFTYGDGVIPIRRARGYAPTAMRVGNLAGRAAAVPHPPHAPVSGGRGVEALRVLAVGGELKCTVCLLSGGEVILSEHLGDITRVETYRHFMEAIARLRQLFAFEPGIVACDMHPRYLTSGYARGLGLPVVEVQHHHAHIASVMAEHDVVGPVIGLACDGTGYGPDHAVWGCEVLRCERGAFERLGHLEYFPLVGGDAAAIETWRPAAALLARAGRESPRSTGRSERDQGGAEWAPLFPTLTAQRRRAFARQLDAGLNAPPTSSLGRVFDAAAFILGLCTRNRHEAEAAMALEAAAGEVSDVTPYAYRAKVVADRIALSLHPTIRELAEGRLRGEPTAAAAARFHETVACMLVDAARLAIERTEVRTVALSGGCFANRRLLGRVVERLAALGLEVLYNRAVPAGDGGLALGQAWVAAWSR